jgi:hypothetical protein
VRVVLMVNFMRIKIGDIRSARGKVYSVVIMAN